MMAFACIAGPVVVGWLIVVSIWSNYNRALSYSQTLHQCYGPDH